MAMDWLNTVHSIQHTGTRLWALSVLSVSTRLQCLQGQLGKVMKFKQSSSFDHCLVSSGL